MKKKSGKEIENDGCRKISKIFLILEGVFGALSGVFAVIGSFGKCSIDPVTCSNMRFHDFDYGSFGKLGLGLFLLALVCSLVVFIVSIMSIRKKDKKCKKYFFTNLIAFFIILCLFSVAFFN